MSYAGWKSWEGWNLNLWITNDEATYAEARMAALGGVDELEQWAYGYVWSCLGFDVADDIPAGVPTDFINASLSTVDYRELRNSLLEGECDD